MEKLFNLYRNILFTVAILLVLVLAVPMIAGIRPYVVLSGSMEPTIHTGSLCYINRNIESADIITGDIIAFNIDNTTVVHRVVGFDEDGRFITKGDNNDVEDISPIDPSKLVGKEVVAIPYAGYASNWVQTTFGRVVIIMAIGLSFVSSFIYRKSDPPTPEKEPEKEKN